MFLIWGSTSRTSEEGSLSQECFVCKNDSLQVYSVRRWFTLFFVPLFPFSSKKYYMGCLQCGNSFSINDEIEEEIRKSEES